MSAYYGQAAFIRQKRAFKGGDKIVNSISWKKPRPRYPFTIFPHFFTVGFRELTLYFRAGVANRVAVHLLPDDNEPGDGRGGERKKEKRLRNIQHTNSISQSYFVFCRKR